MVYLSIDLDAFYCAVEEHYDLSLQGEPFCVYQKQVVCTLSYAARALGIKKLANAQQVRAAYPTMRMINGESLSRYRAAGVMLLNWLRAIVKSPIERLGLEEMRCDVSAAVSRCIDGMKVQQLPVGELPDEAADGINVQFWDTDIELGDFFFGFNGKTVPPGFDRYARGRDNLEYYLAGHMAQYIQEKMRLDTGYSCSIGVGSSISLAKMVCGANKPGGVSVLWPGHEQVFMDVQPLSRLPGFGSKSRAALAGHGYEASWTVKDMHENIDEPQFLRILPKELWDLTWCKEQTRLTNWTRPSQISVEETWPAPLPLSQIPIELDKLLDSLISQAKIDIVQDGVWLVHPSHVRVAVIRYGEPSRQSRSQRLTLQPDSSQFAKQVSRTALRLATEVAKSPIRLLNIAFIFPSS
ncbi:DNA polymerase iota [Wickerhamiella sorbophila]|uniref:DNA polymerase iota n=1 Tax=Wickerhamiella sorbophila TaxID=45607 RepID=A0A2T0FKP7_9ASCO|nr:DNA polymerase iota [Wickerhamiella sorbophila]PRT55558.1 DNA polymerase iota [Wickerhamiella sorbophila]